MKIALAQINVTVGDLDGNARKIILALRRAKSEEADLIIFPELAVPGYPPEDLLFKKNFIRDNLRALKSILSATQGTAAIVGFVDEDKKGNLFNAAAFIENGAQKAVYRKVLLPNYGVFDEKRYFAPGARTVIAPCRKERLGLTICEDIWHRTSFAFSAPFGRASSLVINISASPYHRGKQNVREGLLKRLSRRARVPSLYVNLVGGQDELVFDGGSFAVNAQGRVIIRAKRFEEDLVFLDLKNRTLIPLSRKMPRAPSMEEDVYHALVLGARDYVQKNGFKKVLIGLSGGIDSALVARLAVDAIGASNVLGISMPSPYTSKETLRDARELSRRLGIFYRELSITKIFKSYLGCLRQAFRGLKADATEENIQARIRGNLLMAFSNKLGYLVLTTGNKSEIATGYCTLYGDMAGGFAVIKDVPKTLVFRLARYRNNLSPKDSIPRAILERPPSAELRPHQRDQDTLPPYPLLDRFLEEYVEKDRSLEEIIRGGFPKAVGGKVARMVDGNEYKRRQAPPGIKITPKAFGRDRRMPITNRYRP